MPTIWLRPSCNTYKENFFKFQTRSKAIFYWLILFYNLTLLYVFARHGPHSGRRGKGSTASSELWSECEVRMIFLCCQVHYKQTFFKVAQFSRTMFKCKLYIYQLFKKKKNIEVIYSRTFYVFVINLLHFFIRKKNMSTTNFEPLKFWR